MDGVHYNGFPAGVDNLRANFDVEEGALRDGVNVDVLKSGRVRLRPGITQLIADPDAHSVYSDGTRVVWATKNTLKVAGENFVPVTLLTDVRLAKPLSYVALHGEIYFSNEDVNGIVNVLSQYEPWGVAPPAAAPVLSAVAGERFVQVTCVFLVRRRFFDGSTIDEESGAPLAARIACKDSPIINVSSIPQSADSRVVATRLYVSELDGTELFQHVDVPAGVTSYTLSGNLGLGEQLSTQFLQPPPPGQLLELVNGLIAIAAGSNVFKTRPLRYALYDPDEDYLMFPERVALAKAVADGLYVSAEQTHFLAGFGGADVRQLPVLPYRAIEGASCNLPNGEDVLWLSERGFIEGSAGGAVKNLTEDRIALTRYARGCLGITEYAGHKAYIAITQGGRASPLVAKDYLAAEITRLEQVE